MASYHRVGSGFATSRRRTATRMTALGRGTWRTPPAVDATTREALARRSVFHNRCWRHLEAELLAGNGLACEVRVIHEPELAAVLDDRLAGTALAGAVPRSDISFAADQKRQRPPVTAA